MPSPSHQSRAPQRHNQREMGRFASTATLRAQQRALLAPSARWRKEWVKPASITGQSSYKVLKWVKYDEGGETAEDSEQPTEEQVTAAITGAQTLLVSSNTPATGDTPGTPLASGAPTPGTSLLAPPSESKADGARSPSTLGIDTTTTSMVASPAAPAPEETRTAVADTTSKPIDGARSAAEEAASEARPALIESSAAVTDAVASPKMMDVDTEKPATEAAAQVAQEQRATTATTTEPLNASASEVEHSTQPGTEDLGTDMQVEAEQREHDTNLVPELVGAEAASTRAALGERAGSWDHLSMCRTITNVSRCSRNPAISSATPRGPCRRRRPHRGWAT